MPPGGCRLRQEDDLDGIREQGHPCGDKHKQPPAGEMHAGQAVAHTRVRLHGQGEPYQADHVRRQGSMEAGGGIQHQMEGGMHLLGSETAVQGCPAGADAPNGHGRGVPEGPCDEHLQGHQGIGEGSCLNYRPQLTVTTSFYSRTL